MQILVVFIVVAVVLIFLTNTKRWKGIARGAKSMKSGLDEELHRKDDE
jgi:hypothetical protein